MFFAALLLLPVASAGTLALDITGGTVMTNGNWSLGWQFTVNSSITVDGLAFYDNKDDESHLVGIYNDASQVLLVSTTVLPTDPDMETAP